ncbi:dihydrolipoyl dehydrogenase [Pseudohaliea sp.]|uniref:dihydrolipoyl dehydrogenase n=1 Tax=Pseudohaliea sp. TaxID=2740289 RepID=UPI0032EE1A83
MERIDCEVLIVGAGPGGYVAAIRAGQLGLDTVIVDEGAVGGTCLNRGCIPSKALIHAANEFATMRAASAAPRFGIQLSAEPTMDMGAFQAWKDSVVERLGRGVAGLLRKQRVRHLQGWAHFLDGKTCEVAGADGTVSVRAKHVVLATGAEPRALAEAPFSERVLSSASALALRETPHRLAIIGAGYIGLELGIAFAKLGSKVTLIEAQDRILPGYDEELTRPVAQWLDSHDVTAIVGARLLDCSESADGVSLRVKAGGGETEITADYAMANVGRRPRLEGWGFENLCVDLEGDCIKVDERCHSSMRNVWAIGDITSGPQLAHRASAQGALVAELIAGRQGGFDAACIPAICFTEPEIVTVGLAPDAAEAAGHDVVVGRHPRLASGRALAMGAGDDGGFVRVVARKDNHLVLGLQAVGAHVAELAGEFGLALEMGARLEDLAGTIHSHPSLGEAIAEAALAGLGRALHA